jgi:hypothetical protein
MVSSSQKYDRGFSSRILIFYPSLIPDQGIKKAPDPGSATLFNPEFHIRICINLSCWIQIQVYKLHLNYDFFFICKNVFFDIFSHKKKLFFLTGPQDDRNMSKRKKFPKKVTIKFMEETWIQVPNKKIKTGSGSALNPKPCLTSSKYYTL